MQHPFTQGAYDEENSDIAIHDGEDEQAQAFQVRQVYMYPLTRARGPLRAIRGGPAPGLLLQC